jgi:hypothetical protein
MRSAVYIPGEVVQTCYARTVRVARGGKHQGRVRVARVGPDHVGVYHAAQHSGPDLSLTTFCCFVDVV